MPDGKRTNRNPALMKMAQGRAQELELVYGRGEFEIRYERPTIPEETELDKESDIIHVESGKQTETLKHALQLIKACKLETQQDFQISKQIISNLTEVMSDYKRSISEKRTNSDVNQGRSSDQQRSKRLK